MYRNWDAAHLLEVSSRLGFVNGIPIELGSRTSQYAYLHATCYTDYNIMSKSRYHEWGLTGWKEEGRFQSFPTILLIR